MMYIRVYMYYMCMYIALDIIIKSNKQESACCCIYIIMYAEI